MGWPEALVAVVGLAQVLGLAWIGARQQQVKRDLNGSSLRVSHDLDRLATLIERREDRRPPGVLD